MIIRIKTFLKPQNFIFSQVIFFIILVFGLSSQPVLATAGINRTINFQGKIVNKTDGTNIADNTYSFTFKFYNASSGGTQLPSGTPWSETQSIGVASGIFRATLGASTPIPSTLDFNDDSIYLDITFNGETFGSRVRMTAVPYALNAEKVGGLTVTNTTGTLTIPNAKTISFADAFTTSGANPLTLTTSGTTNVTLPTSGLLFSDATNINFLDAATGTAYSINGSDATSGTNAGGNLTVRAGNASSSGTGGDLTLAGGTTSGGTAGNLIFQTAGSTRWSITNTGALSANGAQTITTTTGALTLGTDTIVGSGKYLRLTGGSGDPTATSGIIWYDTSANKFKVVENGTVKTLCNLTDAGCGTGGSGPWTDGGAYIYPTAGEVLGNSASAGSNKIAGLYLADSSPLYFGTDNDINFSFSGSELAVTQGSNNINFDANTLFVDGSDSRVGVGTTDPLKLFHVNGQGAFGDSVTTSNATRALNLVSTDATMRVLRVTADVSTAAPAVELLARATADGTDVGYWDMYLGASDSFHIRRRTGGNLNVLSALTTGEVGIGLTNPSSKLSVNGTFNSTGIDDNADALALTIDTSERVFIGHTSNINAGGGVNSMLQIQSTGTAANIAGVSANRWSNDTGGSLYVLGKSRSGTIGTFTVVQSGDTLGELKFSGADGTNMQSVAAAIRSIVDGTPGSTDMPGRLEFMTTLDGASAPSVRMTIKNDGKVGIANTDPDSYLTIGSGNITGFAPIGEFFNIRSTASSNANHLAATIVADFTGTDAPSVQGSESWVSLNHASGSINLALAQIAHIEHIGAGNINIAKLYTSSFINNTGSGTVTDVINYSADPIVRVGSPGTVTNAYMFYADTQTSSGITNKYAFYNKGANDLNYFAGKVGLGTTAPTESLQVEGGNILIGAQADATAGSYSLTNSAAGTFGSQANMNGAFSSAVYQGKVYVSVKETDAAGIYRYDGGTTWTRVSDSTAGKIISGDTANVDAIILTVYNGLLWAGTQTSSASGTAAIYSYDGSSWTLRNATRGTFGAETARDGVGDMHVWNGRLYLTTQEVNASGLYRYDGNNTFTRLNATVGKGLSETTADIDDGVLISYNGSLYWGAKTAASTGRVYYYNGNAFILVNTTAGTFASGTTGVDDVTSFAVYNGQLFVGTGETNLANIYVYKGGIPPTAGANVFDKTTVTSGRVDATNDATDVDAIPVMRTYNGRLYAGSSTSAGGNLGAVYEYIGINPASTTNWSLIGSRGTFGSETNIDQVDTLIELENTLYIGTEDSAGNNGSIYSWSKTLQNSYSLKFDSGSGNYGSIDFVGNKSAQDNANHTGTFLFSSPISSTTGAFDYAEDYPTMDNSLEAGELVAVDREHVEFIKRANEDDVYIGVISENPGFRLSLTTEQKKGYTYLPVALVGRVPVKVSTENGTIHSGDYLTGSSIPGVAMKATKSGAIIGQAMESYEGDTVGKILVFVQTSQITGNVLAAYPGITVDNQEEALDAYDGDETGMRILKTIMREQATSDGKKRMAEVFADRIVATKEIIAPHIIADLITAKKIKADSIEGLEIYTNKLSGLGDNVASLEAKLAQLKYASTEGDLETVARESSQNLLLQGLDVEGNATVSGSLQVWGSGMFDGVLNVLDSLTTPNLIVGRWADFIGSAIFRSDVHFIGRTTFNKDTGGYAVVKKGAKSVTILFEKEYEQPPVVNASLTMNEGDANTTDGVSEKEQNALNESYVFFITRRSTKGFTIVLNKPAKEDVDFSWIALGIKDGTISEGVSASESVLSPAPTITPTPIELPGLENVSSTSEASL